MTRADKAVLLLVAIAILFVAFLIHEGYLG